MSSIFVVNSCWSYAPFRTKNTYTVFRTFLLHASIYWAQILCMTFFLWTSDQMIVITWGQVWRRYAPFRCTVLHTFVVHAFSEQNTGLWCFEIELKFLIWLCFFLHIMLLVKYQIIAFKNFHEGRIMHRLQCFGLFLYVKRMVHWNLITVK